MSWPWMLEALISVARMTEAWITYESSKDNLIKIEDRDVVISDELFQKDIELKEFEQTVYDYANDFPEYEECLTSPARIRADVLRIASTQLNKVINQAGRGQIGFRKKMIRSSSITAANEIGGRMGQVRKYEMLLKNVNALQRIKPIVESAISGSYPNILPKSYEAIGDAYAGMMTFGGQMFNGAYATLSYNIGEAILEDKISQKQNDGLKQEPTLTWSPERKDTADISQVTQQQTSQTETFVKDSYRVGEESGR